MQSSRPLFRLLVSFGFALLASSLAFAQTSETGLPPFGSFHGSGIDVVSLENGNLHMQIPIYTVHQRAFPDRTYNFVYDIPGWQMDETPTSPTTFQWRVGQAPHQLFGWHLLDSANQAGIWHTDHDVVAKSCTDSQNNVHQYNVHTNYVLTDRRGTTHPFEVRHVDQPGSGCADPVGNQNTGVALDGTGYTIAIGSNAYSTTISVPNDDGPLNGNSFATSGISETDQNDSHGNLITTTWTYTDSNGASQQIRVDYTSVTFSTHFCSLFSIGSSPCYEASVTSQLPQRLTLPTGKFYQFTWSTDGNGDLLRMDLPTGGYMSYAYQTYTKDLGITYSGSGTGRGKGPPSHHYRVRRQVVSRTLSDGTTANTWTYTGGTVRDPLGNDEVHSFTPMGDPPNPPRYETQILYYQGPASSGTLMKTINKDYASEVSTPVQDAIDHGYINIRLIRETTILDNGQQTKTETDYETFQQPADPTIAIPVVTRLNPTEKRDYAYGAGAPGALLRRTDFAYLHTGNQNYLSRNIVRQVMTTTVYDGNGVQVGKTVNEYDNYLHAGQPMVASNAIQHDPTYTTSFIYRGNVTAVSRWRNTDGALLTTTTQYDDAGNVLSSIDPLGHTTSYDFTDSWSNTSCVPSGQAKVFVTKITNALNQFVTKSYNSCTGTLASSTDLNLQTTTYSYDFLGRPTQKNNPDGGQVSNSYNDVPPISVTTTSKINSSQNLITTKVSDGLGRLTRTQLNSDPQGTVYTDTAYDVLGRVSTISNPYRTGTDITTSSGTTTYTYDALSRKTKEIYPDSSVLQTSYCGASTLVTDPTGKWRRSRTDALGRLVEVDEPNAPGASVASTGCPGTGEPIWVTSYTNDTLGNLTQVVQNGSHQRNFTYDSFSRLLTSSNPETGTITYKYDSDTSCPTPNSFPTLLASKADARGIRTCAQYDALNRLTQRSYSDGTTPTANFGYDQQAPWGWNITNYVGRLTSESNGQALAMFNYDPMGRVINYGQCTPLNCTGSLAAFHVVYTYDLAGNTTQITYYPSGRVVNYTYDSANRPSTAMDGSNGVTYASGFKTSPGGTCIANVTCYTPQGTFYALSIGQSFSLTNGLNLTHIYNSRLQPQEFKASSSGGNAIDISYSFVDPSTSKNAGHVFSITNNLDSTRSQTFSYDQLNRITAAQTTSTYASSPGHCWGETYGVDSWGNLQSIVATTNTNYTGCSQESGFSKTADGNNHLYGFSYDVSGNTTNDGVNSYSWDAESQLSASAGVSYTYDVRGRRVAKSNGKNYVYGTGDEIFNETDATGNTTAEYIFFGGKRVAMLQGTAVPLSASMLSQSGLSAFNPSAIVDGSTACCGWHTDSATPGAWLQVDLGSGNHQAFNQINIFALTSYAGIYNVQYSDDGSSWNTASTAFNPGAPGWNSRSWSPVGAHRYWRLYLTNTPGPGAWLDELQFGPQSTTYYVEDLLGTSRVITTNTGVVCYDADFYPFGGERPYTNTCPQNYKFEGKERDTETGNDDFGARYYSNRFGRWLSADWSAVPVAVPYANLTNPQTLNLYAMVADDPESFADLDGHDIGIWDVVNFVVGAVNAYASDNLVGAGRQPQATTAGKVGAAVGDIAATVQGISETTAGVAGMGTGVAVTTTGVGVVVGAPLAAASAVVAAHGAVTATEGVAHLGAAAGDAINDAIHAPVEKRQGDFKPSEREQKIQENAQSNGGTNKCENCGRDVVRTQNKAGQTPPENQLHVHHDPAIKNGGGRHSKKVVLCRECHQEEHNP